MADRATNLHGCPLASLSASLSVGPTGNILLQDTNLVEHLAQFDRERIPERVVHAKGGGAFGYFEVTSDVLSSLTKNPVFSTVGKRTPIAARFSTVGGETGSADTARDPRGFALKFYTDDGNWDLVGNNTPIFFIRDPVLFPSFIHTQKRNPKTHLKDPDMFWDFISLRPETTHQVSFLFSDRGTPDGFRHMHGYGSHTYKLVNAEGKAVYVKFHFKTDQGIKNLTPTEAGRLQETNPDYAIQDLREAIESGNNPSWTVQVQIMTFDQAATYEWNPFDVTKVWRHGDFPLQNVGKLVLNRNPENYFAEIEQLAFSPANMVPGIEPSPDKMLQGRLFSYTDTQRYRLGVNYAQLPVNKPTVPVNAYSRDGHMRLDNQGGAANYFPNSMGGALIDDFAAQSQFPLSGDVQRTDQGTSDNFSQVTIFWNDVLTPAERIRLVDNIANHLINAKEEIQIRATNNFRQVSTEFGAMLQEALDSLQPRKLALRRGAAN